MDTQHDLYRMIQEGPAGLDGMGVTGADCGVMEYREALDLQKKYNEKVSRSLCPPAVILLEHPPVITLGIREPHNQVGASERLLASRHIDVVRIRRGGGSTAHNPGQLILYPIFKLQNMGLRVAPFVHYLEQTGIDLLAHLGVAAHRRNRYPGIWVGEKKIASLGVQLNKGVTMHGLAINLYNDLSIFSHIVPCGISGVQMTSAEVEGGRVVPMGEAKEYLWKRCLELLPEKGKAYRFEAAS